jgi:hypothetical protein
VASGPPTDGEEWCHQHETTATTSSLLLPFPSFTPEPYRLKIHPWRSKGCGTVVIPLTVTCVPHEGERVVVDDDVAWSGAARIGCPSRTTSMRRQTVMAAVR